MGKQRLIDAYGVQRLLNMSYHGCGLDGFSLGFRKALGLAIQTIENAQTIDPVRHGEWEKPTKKYPYWDWKCSECGCEEYRQRNSKGEYRVMNYCPNCGAKMDKE